MRKNGFRPRPLTTTFSYQPVQQKSPTSALEKKRPGVSRLFLIFTALWMFVLGIIVGRVTTPPDFDLHAVEKELADLREKEMRKDQQTIREGLATLNDTHLDFYDDLRKPERRFPPLLPGDENKGAPGIKKALPKERDAEDSVLTAEKTENKSSDPPSSAAEKTGSPAPPAVLSGNVEMNTAIQLASFARQADADRVSARLKEKEYSGIFISREEVNGVGTRYRVQMGFFRNKSDAEKVLEHLKSKEKFRDAYIFQRK